MHTFTSHCMRVNANCMGRRPMSTAHYHQPSTLSAGLRCRCPRCGQGKLFSGFLKMNRTCSVCGLDFGFAEPADGPAFFVMSGVGIAVVAVWAWAVVAFHPPLW